MPDRFEWTNDCRLFDTEADQLAFQSENSAILATGAGRRLLAALLNDWAERQKPAHLDTVPGDSVAAHNARVCLEPAPCSCDESVALRKRLAVAHRRNALAVEVLCKHNDDLPTNVKLQLWNALHDGCDGCDP